MWEGGEGDSHRKRDVTEVVISVISFLLLALISLLDFLNSFYFSPGLHITLPANKKYLGLKRFFLMLLYANRLQQVYSVFFFFFFFFGCLLKVVRFLSYFPDCSGIEERSFDWSAGTACWWTTEARRWADEETCEYFIVSQVRLWGWRFWRQSVRNVETIYICMKGVVG